MALKLRTKVNFPATVTGTGGFTVVKQNGVWTVSPNFAALAVILGSEATDPSQKQVWLYDPNLNQYNVLTLAGLGDALYLLTSSTSLAVGTGTKTFTTQANKDIGVGSFVLAFSTASPANYMVGQVTAYAGTTLTISVPSGATGGSGTFASWTIRAASPAGVTGATGATGPGYTATSASSNLIANSGSKSFTVAAGLAYTVGARVRATESAGSTAWMEGVVTAYSSTTLTFTTDKSSGAGTFTAWNINLAGEPGTGNIGGSTGGTDGALLRAAGTGGATVQNSTIVVDGSGNMSGVSTLTTTGNIELGNASDTTVGRSAAGIIQVEGVPLYSQIPQNSKSAAYTTVLSDAQKHIYHPSSDNNARTFTIDSNANVPYPVGTCLTFVNEINTVTIAITSDTMTLAGAGTTGNRTLAANGIATALKVAVTKWVISGTGLT